MLQIHAHLAHLLPHVRLLFRPGPRAQPGPRARAPWRQQAIRPWPEAFYPCSNSRNSFLLNPTSHIISIRIPLPSSSPGCTGITVLLPSGCFMMRWLPLCRTGIKPILPNALMITPASTGLNFNDLHSYKASNGAAAFCLQIE